ncbi:MAG: kinase anchor protein, partial [Candidatus Nanohaloarchaea archaeon]|nr:kinase anchor protein [Candidatus Nanohaloarchaea archaeon]
MGRGDDYIREADEQLGEYTSEEMSLEEYVDQIFENPNSASHASRYLLNAIEYEGTRTVVEEGETKERYRFFDDPHNEGEHAILGNTEVLNDFVGDLRSIASDMGKDEKIIWLSGPTATGKSEFKECLKNGLKAYSKTDEGKRYTIEWNPKGSKGSDEPLRYLEYAEPVDTSEDNWIRSPVQTHPLKVFDGEARETREQIIEDLNNELEDHEIDIMVDGSLDPVSQKIFDYLEEQYRKQSDEQDDIFSKVTDEGHLRVTDYIIEEGQGIGILTSEDEGNTKHKLVGRWKPHKDKEPDPAAGQDPLHFTYDGILCQGNNMLTVVEDASRHPELIQDLLNVPDEKSVKLDKQTKLDVDTLMIMISNPDLVAKLNKQEEAGAADELKALKRRLDKRDFKYLTNYSLETELLRREVTNETDVWKTEDYDELKERIEEPITMESGRDGKDIKVEIAPHGLEAAAMYNIVSRLEDDMELEEGSTDRDFGLIEKALLYDQGEIQVGDETKEKDAFSFENSDQDGRIGIPATYTRDVIADLIQNKDIDPDDDSYELDRVIMPDDILEAMKDNFSEEEMFSEGEQLNEVEEYMEKIDEVQDYVLKQQEEDVLDAILRDQGVSEHKIERYVDNLYSWKEEEDGASLNESEEPDKDFMRVFEQEELGKFDQGDYASRG